MKKIIIILLSLSLFGCASELKSFDTAFTNAVMGSPTSRMAANKNKSSMDLCLGLVTNNTFADIKTEYGKELANRNEDCSKYQAMMIAHVQTQAARSAAALNYLATTQQQSQTYFQKNGTIMCRNNGYGTVFCNY